MGVYIINAGSVPGQAAGSAYSMVVNSDGSINTTGTISGTITAVTAANRSNLATARYTASSGVPTFFSGLAVPNDFELVIKALSTNINQVGIGSNFGVIGSAFNLYPNDAIRLGITNANIIQFVTITNGDGVEIITET